MAENNNLQMPIETATYNDNLSTQRHIESLIYNIRDQQVMLDKDLAVLYGVETRVLNQAVKRNKERFPRTFYVITLLRIAFFQTNSLLLSKTRKYGILGYFGLIS